MGHQRREKILLLLADQSKACSASWLAAQLKVSRQVIVGDIALLRASGQKIEATPRGYLLPEDDEATGSYQARVACRHRGDQMAEELYLIVDLGGKVHDVIVEHPVYGQLTGQLLLASRYDVDQFIARVESQQAQPLSGITDGLHLHTISCPGPDYFQRIVQALKEHGFLFEED